MASSPQVLWFPSLLLLLPLLLLMVVPSDSQSTCSSQSFSKNRIYALCSNLPQLSSALHWNYDSSNSTLSIAFVAAPSKTDGWISWAINPTGTGMAGSQSLIAFRQADGSMVAKTYNVSENGPVHESKIAFEVSDLSAESSGGVMTIFAKLKLPAGMSKVNQVWQVGPSVSGSSPAKHDFNPDNLQAKGTLDLLKGQTSSGGTNSRFRKANTHGVLNAVSWGILLPIGAIVARYLKTFKSADPAWFYLHVSCQLIGYGVGVAGWATGLSLGNQSKGVVQTTHRNVGIALFSLATLQIFALFLRPKKDHKFRVYWNVYHHAVGYAVIILGVFNIFKGLDILRPDNKWKTAYIAVISVLGGIAVFLEAITWIIVLRRRKGSDNTTKLHDNTGNGHGRQPV